MLRKGTAKKTKASTPRVPAYRGGGADARAPGQSGLQCGSVVTLNAKTPRPFGG